MLGKDILVAPELAPRINVALSAQRLVVREPGERAAFRLIECRGHRVGGEPA
jgi:hypothetical protein